jgi:hypothetical protein
MRRMEDHPARERRQAIGGWVSYEPLGTPEVKSPATRTGQEQPEGLAAHRNRHARLLLESSDYFEAKTRDVWAGRPAELRTTGGTVTSRLVRFRHGASVLEWGTVSVGWTGHGSMRLDEGADTRHAIVERLALLVLELGPDARPIPD